MPRLPFTLSFALAAVLLSGWTRAERVDSEGHACARLLEAAPETRFAPKKSSEYYCRLNRTSSRYFIFSLHAIDPEPRAAAVGSDFIDWFAVRRDDGVVLRWDAAKGAPGEALPK